MGLLLPGLFLRSMRSVIVFIVLLILNLIIVLSSTTADTFYYGFAIAVASLSLVGFAIVLAIPIGLRALARRALRTYDRLFMQAGSRASEASFAEAGRLWLVLFIVYLVAAYLAGQMYALKVELGCEQLFTCYREPRVPRLSSTAIILFGTLASIVYFFVAICVWPFLIALLVDFGRELASVGAMPLVTHPAEQTIVNPNRPPLELLDHRAVSTRIREHVASVRDAPSAFWARIHAARTRALREVVQADRELADEVIKHSKAAREARFWNDKDRRDGQ